MLVVVLALPLMNLPQDEDAPAYAQALALFAAGAVTGLVAGPGPAMPAEMFPRSVRCTGLGRRPLRDE